MLVVVVFAVMVALLNSGIPLYIYALAEGEMLDSAWLLFLEGTPEPVENIDHKLLKK